MPLEAHPGQSLADHLLAVAEKAKTFSRHFDALEHGALAGLLHDLGKAEPEFQKRIHGEKGEKHPHAYHGAALALRHQLWPVAFAINGHHAGLHNRSDLQQVSAKLRSQTVEECQQALKGDADWKGQEWPIQTKNFPKTLPAWLEAISFTTAGERDAKMRAVDFYTRMLFSTLVDSDRLDTEDANRAEGSQANVLKRKAWRFGPKCLAANGAAESLLKMLETAINDRVATARSKNASDAVMDVRAEVLAACKEKASCDCGVFTLAVPTGGGKTLASVAFALQHIADHNKDLAQDDPHLLRRIIVVIPYLNIIQQTTGELKSVFGHTDADPVILEHHSQAADPTIKKNDDADGWDKERPLRQLAAENWDAPIIVTTSVQFFDSLFSRRPADARKLHNICQSVLIFDEVQTLPPLLLQPILDALKELTSKERRYGASLVLCTATQPALGKSENFEFGFENVIPIIRARTALIKLYFKTNKDITMNEQTHENQNHPAYLCGRVLALMDKIHNAAHGKSTASSPAGRYYGSASSTPALVFPRLCKLARIHLEKIEQEWAFNLDRDLTGLVSKFSAQASWPRTLSLEDQGRFAIGFYYERAPKNDEAATNDIRTKNDSNQS
jgi:CRISPR-associated endonuclease/helicase Cas3